MTQEGPGSRHVQFDLRGAPAVKKEAAVLSESSLVALGRQVAPMCTKLGMMLNVPTVTLILLKLRVASDTQNEDASKMAAQFLLYWKQMRAGAKDKEKVAELERALRDTGNAEVADVFADRHKDNVELTADCFAH